MARGSHLYLAGLATAQGHPSSPDQDNDWASAEVLNHRHLGAGCEAEGCHAAQQAVAANELCDDAALMWAKRVEGDAPVVTTLITH
jgi:hypothetical protein